MSVMESLAMASRRAGSFMIILIYFKNFVKTRSRAAVDHAMETEICLSLSPIATQTRFDPLFPRYWPENESSYNSNLPL